MKQNCWQAKNCGRQPGGAKTSELGVCPAATDQQSDGNNQGKKGGRYCWKIAGTLCGGKIQGSYATKLLNCVTCEFYKKVKEEESENFKA